MKKYLLMIVATFGLLFAPMVKAGAVEVPELTDHEKVTIYLFWSSECSHCHDFIEYFGENYIDYTDYFEVIGYQVNNDNSNTSYAANSSLMSAVGEVLDETEGYIPLIVIGDEYHTVGFGSDGTEIIEAALEAYQNEEYTDLVAEIMDSEGIDAKAVSLEEACDIIGVKYATNKDSSGISDGVAIGIIFAVVILGFGGLIIYSRKK